MLCRLWWLVESVWCVVGCGSWVVCGSELSEWWVVGVVGCMWCVSWVVVG